MHTHRPAIYGLLAAVACSVVGCQSGQPAAAESPAAVEAPAPAAGSEPVPVAVGEYDRVWAASVDVLRDWQFVVNRRDRRFGVITTDPQPASTFFEPWRPDTAHTDRLSESTVNYERRTVRIILAPVDGTPIAPAGAAAEPAPAGVSGDAGTPYRLAVVVSVDRRHHPPRQLNTAAVRRFRIANAPDRFKPVYTEVGLQESYWEPRGRDAEFERHLTAAILQRAAEIFAQPTPRTPAAPTVTPAEPAN